MSNNFERGQVDTMLTRKLCKKDFIVVKIYFCKKKIVKIYVDNYYLWCYYNEKLYKEFSKLMQSEFETRMMGELKFFLGIQVK